MSNRITKLTSTLTFVVSLISFSLIAPLLIFGITIGLSLIFSPFSIDTTFLTVFFLITCTLYNIFVILIIKIKENKVEDGEDIGHFFSILVPANNEENVIKDTIKKILNIDYPSELFEVIVINDGSTDETKNIVNSLQVNNPNLKLINIPKLKGCKGKSSALNTGFADFLLTWRGIEIRPRHRWIIGVFDSDALPDSNMFKKVSFQFKDPNVGGVQTYVRIKNRRISFLAKMQDIEFVTFSRIVQFARNMFKGAVALGGNGQFVRAIALDSIALKDQDEYWKEDALTEDLEIGIRLTTKKWENRYIDSSCVQQEGVETFRAIFNQRERWALGHIQTLSSYALSSKLWASKVFWRTKIDSMFYLFYILIPSMVLISWIWSGLSLLGIISVYSIFPAYFTIGISFSFFPLLGYGLLKEKDEYPVWQILPLLIVMSFYTYHWIPCTTSAIIKMMIKKPNWKKTPRFTKSTTEKAQTSNNEISAPKKPEKQEIESKLVCAIPNFQNSDI
jgi:1,2-diacylglycerol 3-beta-glucosyltransferase